MHFLVAFTVVAIFTGCASMDAPRRAEPSDYAAMSCRELAEEAKRAWRRKHVPEEKQAAKEDLRAIKSAAIVKNCVLPG